MSGAAGPGTGPGTAFGVLVRLETRKVVDTRAGRTLLLVIALLAVLALGLTARFGPVEDVRFGYLVAVTSTVLTVAFPVLAVLAVTAETAHRTALVTFAVEPRRRRVAAAKLLASGAWAAVGLVVAVALGAAAHAVAAPARGVRVDLSPDWASLGGFALALALAVAQGVGFGLVLRARAAALAAYLVAPAAWAFVAAVTPGLARVAAWVDPTVPGGVLVRGGMHGADWAHLACANALWVLLPLAAGVVLLERRDVA